ncbi:hypothetical protein KEM52_002482 [Ascosphaera acerosa]|nr:hypothetical protein KEM52_002482 [Ascosphaera acerosa]
MTSSAPRTAPPAVRELTGQVARYYSARVVYWACIPPQVLAVAGLLTGRGLEAPPGFPRSADDSGEKSCAKAPWPALWASGERTDINRAVTKLYNKTSSWREGERYREVYSRLVHAGGFLNPPLGPKRLRTCPPYAKGTDSDLIPLRASSAPLGEVSNKLAKPQQTAGQDGVPLGKNAAVSPKNQEAHPPQATPAKKAVSDCTPLSITPNRRGQKHSKCVDPAQHRLPSVTSSSSLSPPALSIAWLEQSPLAPPASLARPSSTDLLWAEGEGESRLEQGGVAELLRQAVPTAAKGTPPTPSATPAEKTPSLRRTEDREVKTRPPTHHKKTQTTQVEPDSLLIGPRSMGSVSVGTQTVDPPKPISLDGRTGSAGRTSTPTDGLMKWAIENGVRNASHKRPGGTARNWARFTARQRCAPAGRKPGSRNQP